MWQASVASVQITNNIYNMLMHLVVNVCSDATLRSKMLCRAVMILTRPAPCCWQLEGPGPAAHSNTRGIMAGEGGGVECKQWAWTWSSSREPTAAPACSSDVHGGCDC
jgi:hypothetical protein